MCGASASAASDPQSRGRTQWYRILLLALGGAGLVAGICTGLARLGFGAAPLAALAEYHGPLFVNGMFGTLTTLERAVASRRPLDYMAPTFCGLGTLFVLFDAAPAGAILYVFASFIVSIYAIRSAIRRPALFAWALAASSLFWLMGNIVWFAGASVPEAVGWWLAFLVFVIGGERLEFGGPRPEGTAFVVCFWASVLLIAVGSWFTILESAGSVLFGGGLMLCALWTIANDRTVWTSRPHGQTRFMAASLGAGYGWLAVGGVVLLAGAGVPSAFTYDMTIHALVLGLAFSMVFGHALVVLPSILRLDLVFTTALYVPLALLQTGVALRIAGGVSGWMEGRMLSGPVAVLAIAGFTAIIAGQTIKARLTLRDVRQPARV